jgi:hypothetical protein
MLPRSSARGHDELKTTSKIRGQQCPLHADKKNPILAGGDRKDGKHGETRLLISV